MIPEQARSPETGQADRQQRSPLPISRPRVIYVFLVLIAVAFVIQLATGSSRSGRGLLQLGAQLNSLVAMGEYWRLITAMFLHSGIQHVAFNAWGIFIMGQDIEAFYGPVWFTLIYLLSGLGGNVAYYLLGPNVPSLGASGAVFGLVGAEAAYFLRNRRLFGAFGRQRLTMAAVLIAVNLVFGFTVSNINNIAHLGGLVFGLGLGLLLAPRYRRETELIDGQPMGVLVDRQPLALRVLAVSAAAGILVVVLLAGNNRWSNSPDGLRERAFAAYDAGETPVAQQLLEQALESAPQDEASLYALGYIYAEAGKLSEAVGLLKRLYALNPEDADTLYLLGAVYLDLNQVAEARPYLERFLEREPEGTRADAVRKALSGS